MSNKTETPCPALSTQKLRELETRDRLFVEQIPAIVWATDMQLRFTSSLGAGLKSLGLAPNEVSGMSLYEFFDTDDPDFPPIRAQRQAIEGHANNLTWEWRGRVFQTHFEPLYDEMRQIAGGIGIALDITEKSRLQAELLHAQKIESIGRIAAGIAHDFRNLLVVQKGYLDSALKALDAESSPARILRELQAVNSRAEEMASNILAFSRKKEPLLDPVDLNDVLRKMTSVLTRVLPEDIEITADAERPLPRVSADRGMIEQVLLNLALNAADAMPEGGDLHFSVSAKHVRPPAPSSEASDEQLFVYIQVADSGCGMPRGVREKIFEPFFTTKKAKEGAGIGLSTAYEIVRQHGGWIEVVTTVGIGSTFTVYLPAIG